MSVLSAYHLSLTRDHNAGREEVDLFLHTDPKSVQLGPTHFRCIHTCTSLETGLLGSPGMFLKHSYSLLLKH